MRKATSIVDLHAVLSEWRQGGVRIAFVPTMGNLHAGHIRLMSEARRLADRVVASIFVNPAQFVEGEDFAAYPRTPDEDTARLQEAGIDLLFLPDVEQMYPSGTSGITFVEVPGLSERLCGQFRPGHFRGVATVVCKLFNIVQPDVALFGEKDFQQLAVIRRMTADLNLPVEVLGVPTVREPSGLAMSSRNGYLSAEEKEQAAFLYRLLRETAAELMAGSRDFPGLEAKSLDALRAAGFRPDYFSILRSVDLEPPTSADANLVILSAAWIGRARLIDNLPLRLVATA